MSTRAAREGEAVKSGSEYKCHSIHIFNRGATRKRRDSLRDNQVNDVVISFLNLAKSCCSSNNQSITRTCVCFHLNTSGTAPYHQVVPFPYEKKGGRGGKREVAARPGGMFSLYFFLWRNGVPWDPEWTQSPQLTSFTTGSAPI